uniref:Uncharacterized protein n=1 Tax=Palpitomonas bilix TaxID=652834 RepID=A0A7S3GA08_9EUKA|mmetsp:Transcript_3183/g.6164  ORF Transcript_3183/g.6164 Transcript_3183/m.6164 type:complete len:159 (+) Transcript_3183:38-514(+)
MWKAILMRTTFKPLVCGSFVLSKLQIVCGLYPPMKGVNFMEKTVSVRGTMITFSIWDLGGHKEFVNMLPLVCNDAQAILFLFDLTRTSTLNSVKDWFKQARGFNKDAKAILVGTKYDTYASNMTQEEQQNVTKQVGIFIAGMILSKFGGKRLAAMQKQ